MHGEFPSGISRRAFMQGLAVLAATLAWPESGLTADRQPGAPLPQLDYTRDIILKNCRVIDVHTGQFSGQTMVRISGSAITALGAEGLETSSAQIIDCAGACCIPGLIDAHCHITAAPIFSLGLWDLPRLIKAQRRQFAQCITAGITTVRDMGAFPGLLHGFIRAIEKGRLLGPRVVYCNSILNVKGSHPDINPRDITIFAGLLRPLIGLIPYNFNGMDELKQALPANAQGASLIKLTVDNRSIFCRSSALPVYSDAELGEIFDFAQARGLPVACHNHRHWGFRRMLGYPVHSMEHMIGDGYLSDAEVLRLAANKTAVVPTLSVAQSYLIDEAYDSLPPAFRTDFILQQIQVRKHYLAREAPAHFDPVLIRKATAELANYRKLGWEHLWENKKFLVNPDLYFGVMLHAPQNLKKLKEAGVLIGCGMDAGMPFNYFGGLYREFGLLSACGFSNAEVLRCATMNNAKILCLEDKTGSLEPGKYADIVLLHGNPLADLQALRAPAMVMQQGRVLYAREFLKLTP